MRVRMPSLNLNPNLLRLGTIILLCVGMTARAHGQTQIFVVPTQAWTPTNLTVTAGQKLTITATGEMDFDTNNTCPSGQSCTVGPDGSDPGGACVGGNVVDENLACNSLIGRINGGTPFEVGANFSTLSATASGELDLGVNDSYFADNTLGWTATVTIQNSCLPSTNTQSTSRTNSCPINKITSETFATVPGIDNKIRTTLGIGEQVWLYADPPQAANWSITSTSGLAKLAGAIAESVSEDPRFADGKQLPIEADKHFRPERGLPDTECDQNDLSGSQTNADTVCLSTPYVNDQITVTATFGDGSTAFKKFTVTQPTGLILQRLEYPDNTTDSDFNFLKYPFAHFVEFKYSPAVFVTPGNVSFAYAGIVERDPGHERGDYAPPYNLRFSLNGTTAWLVTCDLVTYRIARDHDQFAYPWNFSAFDKRSETSFSLVQTKWDYVAGEFSSSKGQIEALSPGLAPVQTPITSATAAELNVIDRDIPYFSYEDVPRPQCPPQVVNQFTCLSGEYCTKPF